LRLVQLRWLVQPPYKIGGDNIVVGGHCCQLDLHILQELLARRLRRARLVARQFSWLSGPGGLQRACIRAFEDM